MEFAKLVIAKPGVPPTEVVIGALTSIGRAPGNTIVLDEPHVSRHHTVIRVNEGGTYLISDLGSSNGTYLNARRVLLPERLRHRDVIKIGAVTLTFMHAASERPQAQSAGGDDYTMTGEEPRHELTVVGTGPAMEAVFRLMTKAAGSTIAVLIQGETGTGKELVARAIHAVSARGRGPFLAVNCAAMPETLLESQLFGHRRGSFTGADRDRVGLFEAATGGTLLLDEIGEMPVAMQAKLLRVLQEGEITPVGDTKPRPVDVRVLSATNRDLSIEVTQRRFREDLFYRLASFPIVLPPLRERREDIPVLVERFAAQAAHAHRKRIDGIAPEAMECLQRFDWPGNVRELQNEVQRAVVLAEHGETLAVEHLSPRLRGDPETADESEPIVGEEPAAGAQPAAQLREARAQFEARHIADVLRQQGGNVSRAAVVLGLSRMQLHRKLKEYGIR
jgi:two-component system, NtrC family, response regulator HupR/HoxA